MTARTGSRSTHSVTPLPRNVGEFLGALRDQAAAGGLAPADAMPRGLTQGDLEKALDMSRPSIMNLIRYCDPVLYPPRATRPRGAEITLDPVAGLVVAVDLGHSHARVGLADLAGRIGETVLEQSDEAILVNADPTLDWAVGAIGETLADAGRSADDVVGVGVSLAGPVDPGRGAIRAAAHLAAGREDWQLMSITGHLRSRLGWGDEISFMLDNDANLGALAEHTWGVARRRQNVIYVEWSRGIGAGLILQGELYRGEGAAGELGHVVVDPASDRKCELCGNRGCLESVAGWEAIRASVGAVASPEELFARARTDQEVRAVLEAAARAVAQVVGGLVSVINPQLLVIGGVVGGAGFDLFRTAFHDRLSRSTMRPALKDVDVVPAALPGRPALQGAVALVMRPPADDVGTERDALFTYLHRRTVSRATDRSGEAGAAAGERRSRHRWP